MELPSIDELLVDLKQDSLPPIPIGLYRAFMAKGTEGIDALVVYLHLLFTYRLQKSDRVYANQAYIARGVHMGSRRVKKARHLLRELDLISTVHVRGEHRQFSKQYTKLNLLPNPKFTEGALSAPTVITSGAESAPSATDGAGTVGVGSAPRNAFKKQVKKSGSKTRRSAEESGDFSFITSLFFERYMARLGVNPAWGKREGALLKSDLARLGRERLAAAVGLFFGSQCPSAVSSWCAQAGWTYGIFHTQLGKLEVILAAQRPRTLRKCPKCGKGWDTSSGECPACHVALVKQEAASA